MLDVFRDAPLLTSPDGLQGGYFVAVDARKYRQASDTPRYEVDARYIEEAEVDNWAHRTGHFAAPSPTALADEFDGGIRVLFAQPQSMFKTTIPGVLATSEMLSALGLPASTFTSFQLAGGTFSLHTTPEGTELDVCDKLSIVFRTPQKWECTVGGLAISHDFKTRITTALSVGYAFALDQRVDSLSPLPSAFTNFLSKFEKHASLWTHPLFLPNLFLVEHTLRVSNFIMQSLDRQVIRLEYCIGVTKAGRSNKPHLDFPDDKDLAIQQKLYIGDQLQRNNARTLMEDINDLTTKLEFTKWSPTWDNRFAVFSLRLLERSQRLQNYGGTSVAPFRETLEYVQNYSQSLCEVAQSHYSRMQLQLNILYTSIAQDDGQTNARLAASAGKDSTSMKIIALITAAYLPGTFVATLLSMNMFDWRFGQDSNVAKDFWIYWAIAIPLTIVTISGWALWWSFEKRRFERVVQKAAQQQQTQSSWQQSRVFDGIKSHVLGVSEK